MNRKQILDQIIIKTRGNLFVKKKDDFRRGSMMNRGQKM